MDEPTRQLLAEAARIRLSRDENADIRDNLTTFMAGDVSEYELDPLIQAFFKEAAGVSLTVDETDERRLELEQFMMEQSVKGYVEERHLLAAGERSAVFGDPTTIDLSKEERSAARRDLVSYMERSPAYKPEQSHEESFSLGVYVQDFWRVILPRTAALACLFLVVSTGVAFAAESAFPGDWLYPLKVEVFEQVRGRFIVLREERAQWEAARAMRRLEEAEWLAAHDDLTSDVWVHLHGHFVGHVMEVEHHIDVLARNGQQSAADHLSADLDVYLQAHRAVLQAIASERGNSPHMQTVVENVHAAQQDVRRRRTERLGTGLSEDATERNRQAAESGIRSAINELSRVPRTDRLPAGSQAAARLREAEEMLSEATDQFEAGIFGEAESIARGAVRKAAEATLLRKLPRELLPVAAREESHSSASTIPPKKEEVIGTVDNPDVAPVTTAGSASVGSASAAAVLSSVVSSTKEISTSASSVSEVTSSSASPEPAPVIKVDLPVVDIDINPSGLLP